MGREFRLAFSMGICVLFMGCSKVTQLAEKVSKESLNIPTTSLSPAVVGKYYNENLTAAGGSYPYTFSLSSGSLPSGLTFSSTGEIAGIPTVTTTGTSLVFNVTDSKGDVASHTLTLVVSDELIITTDTLAPALVNTAYSAVLSTVGGTGTNTFSATGLPTGFVINSTSGIISGISSTTSSGTAIIKVVDSSGLQDSKSFTFSVTATPVITTVTLSDSAITQAYSVTLSVSDGSAPYFWSLQSGTLPSGLSLSSGGVISGTPTDGSNLAHSPFSFVVLVTDSLGQTDTQTLSLAVDTIPHVLDDFRAPLGATLTGVSYSDWVRSEGGTGAVTYSATGLPTGLTLNSTSGHVSGTPTGAAATYDVVFTATSASGLNSNTTKKIRVASAAKSNPNYSNAIQTPIGLYGSNWAYPAQLGFDVGTMNNDVTPDVLWGGQDSRGILSLIGDGTGNFTKTFFASPGSARPRMVKLFNLNADSVLDVVSSTADNRLEIYLGNASYWPNSPTSYSFNVGFDNYGFDVSDLNSDGKNDIVLTDWTNGRIRVYFNCGSSATVNIPGSTACNKSNSPMTLHEVTISTTVSQPRDVVIYDFDGDSKKDIIFTSYNTALIGMIRGNDDGTFGTPTTLLIGASGPRGIARADMNLDGKMDVVITGDNAVSVMLNASTSGTINFSATSYAINDLGVNSEDLDLGDLDGDGYPDVAFVSGGTDINSLGVFMNDGAGGLASRRMIDSGYQTFGVKLAPVLSASITAGKPDLLTGVGHWISFSRLMVYPNSLTATPISYGARYKNTSPASYATTYGVVRPADFNEDGYVDIIYKLGGAANLMLGSSTGVMTLSSVSIPTGDITAATWHGLQTQVADVNGDGHIDFISGNWNNGGLGTVTVVLGNGDGTFGSQSTVTVDVTGCLANMGVRTVDVGDFNRDGKMDIVAGAGCSSPSANPRAYVFFGNGDGTFSEATRKELVGTSNYVYLLAARDVNNDGITDVVIVSNDSVVRQYTNDGNGNFTLFGQSDMSMSSTISMLSLADLDKNGGLDYVVTSQSSSSIGRSMSTATGTVSGGTTTTITGTAGDYTGQPQMGSVLIDFDDDGITDLITMRRFQDMNPSNRNGGGGFHFYKGSIAGSVYSLTVQSRVFTPIAYGPYSEGYIVPVDVNRDGVLDLINSNIYGGTDGGIGINLNSSQ